MTKYTDHPFTRNGIGCPLCGGDKERGLLICWPCHRALKAEFDGGYGYHAEDLLDKHEAYLQDAEDRYEAHRS
jgi:hypothetical protein